jgi:hypothetical protein
MFHKRDTFPRNDRASQIRDELARLYTELTKFYRNGVVCRTRRIKKSELRCIQLGRDWGEHWTQQPRVAFCRLVLRCAVVATTRDGVLMGRLLCLSSLGQSDHDDWRSAWLYIFSLALLITGFLCIWSAWHGDANFTTGIPAGLSSIQLCGTATGSRTLAGFLSGIVGTILYGVALVRTILDEIGG